MLALSQPVGICYFVVGNRQLAVGSWQLSVGSYRMVGGGSGNDNVLCICGGVRRRNRNQNAAPTWCAKHVAKNNQYRIPVPVPVPVSVSLSVPVAVKSSQVFSRVSCLASSWKCGYFMGLQMAINLYSFYAESVSYSVNLLVNFHSQLFPTPHSSPLTQSTPIRTYSFWLGRLALTLRLAFSKFGRQQTLLWTLYEFLCFFSSPVRVLYSSVI